ncbi:MAG: radical SAM protein [Spirochaetaceae bacterium]|jgi:DNA repair photolyase|nr:radical SAM protein [Spirochaetaceae bacterium]
MIAVNEIKVKNIITKTRVPAGDYGINPYIGCPHGCIYCYADFIRRFTNHAEKWGGFLDVKIYGNKLNIKRLSGKTVVFSTATDSYNFFEKKYMVTRNILEQFTHSDVKVEILTKSDLIIRDIDLYKRIPNIRVGISLNTLDDSIRRELEPGAPAIERRLNAIKKVHTEGINTYIFLSPMFPGITDYRAILNECRNFAGMFYFENLNLRGSYRPVVLNYIRNKHPDLIPLYDDIYKFKTNQYWHLLEKEIFAFCHNNGLKCGSYFYHEKIRK